LTDAAVDQAEGLRRIFGAARPTVVTFLSGRGAVGKTSVVVSVGAALAESGREVLLVDENATPRSIGATLGVDARADLLEAVRSDRAPAGVACAARMRLLPVSRVTQRLASFDDFERDRCEARVRDAVATADFVLVDAPSGALGSFSAWGAANQHVVVVLSRSEAAITDAYSLVKRVVTECGERVFHVLVNRVGSPAEARRIFDNFAALAGARLRAQAVFSGHVSTDDKVWHARELGRPVTSAFPASRPAQEFRAIAALLAGLPVPRNEVDPALEYAQRVTLRARPPIRSTVPSMHRMPR
jgi:flagellar biosynthesis protein FlhG